MIPLPDPPMGDGVVAMRPWGQEADADALADAWADPAILAWARVPEPRDVAAARRWISGEQDRRRRWLAIDLVVHPSDDPGDVVGEVGLAAFRLGSDGARTAEIGYWVRSDRRGDGVARRAVGLVCAWSVRTLGLAVVEASIEPANIASQNVVESVGFARTDESRWRYTQ